VLSILPGREYRGSYQFQRAFRIRFAGGLNYSKAVSTSSHRALI
jgi:hypothetical protein